MVKHKHESCSKAVAIFEYFISLENGALDWSPQDFKD